MFVGLFGLWGFWDVHVLTRYYGVQPSTFDKMWNQTQYNSDKGK